MASNIPLYLLIYWYFGFGIHAKNSAFFQFLPKKKWVSSYPGSYMTRLVGSVFHWRLADARNCSYGQPNMADDDSG